MACLIVPATAVVALSAVKKRIPVSYHFEWLLMMLGGGTIMLVVDHIFSGELILQPPFFTAGLDQIVWEVFRVGIPMTLATFFVWVAMVIISVRISKIQRSTQ